MIIYFDVFIHANVLKHFYIPKGMTPFINTEMSTFSLNSHILLRKIIQMSGSKP